MKIKPKKTRDNPTNPKNQKKHKQYENTKKTLFDTLNYLLMFEFLEQFYKGTLKNKQ